MADLNLSRLIESIEWFVHIPGAPGYLASNQGRIASLHRWQKEPDKRWRLLRTTAHPRTGHHRVYLRQLGKHHPWAQGVGVHILVAAAWHGPRPDGMLVCHTDDAPGHNAASNLSYGNESKNMRDRSRNRYRRAGQLSWSSWSRSGPDVRPSDRELNGPDESELVGDGVELVLTTYVPDAELGF